MRASDFLIWLKGFLAGKEQLSQDETNILVKELECVDSPKSIELGNLLKRDFFPMSNPPINPILSPTEGGSGCKFPSNCGMPTVWYGISPPVCLKCGLNKEVDVTYDSNAQSHITGKLNEAQD